MTLAAFAFNKIAYLLHLLLSFSLSPQSKVEECNEQLELKRRDIAKVQEREKTLAAAFQASLGEENKFEEFLTKVFRKRIKRVKKKEPTGDEGIEETQCECVKLSQFHLL